MCANSKLELMQNSLRNTNISKLSREIKINRYTLYRILKGKIKRPSYEVMIQIEKYLKGKDNG